MTLPFSLALGLLLAPAGLGASPNLDKLVEGYFRSPDPARRAELAESIERLVGSDLGILAEALHRAQLWSFLPADVGQFVIPSDSGPRVIGIYQLPAGYNARRSYPAIVCMPEDEYSSPQAMERAVKMLDGKAGQYVLICPQWPGAGAFHQPGAVPGYLKMLLHHARKRIHTDTDRVFLFGVGKGGDAAWLAALAHSDLFAGAIILSGYPHVPYPEAMYPLLLGNLRGVAVLTAWSLPVNAGRDTRDYAVAAHNRAIVALAEKKSLPIKGLELDPEFQPRLAGSPLPDPLKHQIAKILNRRRRPPGGDISHWFRYPSHGDADWLVQTRY